MASGAADRLDVTAWIVSARSTSAVRSGWEIAGVAARSGTSAQDHFGAALNAAQAETATAAARARAATQHDAAAATQARQAVQHDQADASRAATERARNSAVQAEARAAERRPETAKPVPGKQDRPQGTVQADEPPPPVRAPADRKTVATNPQAGATDRTGAQPFESAAQARDAAPDSAVTATQDPAQADPTASSRSVEAAQPQHPDPAAPISTDPAAALLALLATLAEGGPIRTAGTATGPGGSGPEDAAPDKPINPAKTGPAGTAVVAAPGLQTGGAADGSPAGQGAVSGIAGSTGGASAPVAPATPGKGGKNPVPVEGAQATPGDATVGAATGGRDFLAALADAGQGGSQGPAGNPVVPQQGTPPTVQGVPQPAGLQAASAGPSGAGQAAATLQTSAPVQTDAAIPIGQVPMTIGLRSLGGSNEFRIRLDPAELGRIDVKLEIDRARGTVMTHLVVDRPDTLAMLQRDAGQLQQALSQAGLDPSGGGLNLSLRGDGGAQGGGGGRQDNAPNGGTTSWTRDQAEAPQEIAPTRWLRGYGGVDIRI